MPFPSDPAAGEFHRPPAEDPTSGFRVFAASIGIVLVMAGAGLAGYLFYNVIKVMADPRSFSTQVDRWEFVVRGQANDLSPGALELPDRQKQAEAGGAAESDPSIAAEAAPSEAEKIAHFAGRMGSKAARPGALLMIVILLTLLVRIAIALIDSGARLVHLAAGEKEFMKRLLYEITTRNRSGQ